MKKKIALGLVLSMGLMLFAGCGGGGEETEPAENEGNANAVKVGITAPLTGNASIYGMAVKQGAEIAVEEVNELGGVQFEFKAEDDANDAEKAVNAYNALKDWGMQVSLCSTTSTPATATAAEHGNDRLFGLTPSGSAPSVTEGKDNVYQMCFSDPGQGTASAEYIAEQKLGEKIAVIYKNDDVYSAGVYEKFAAEAERLNLNIVETQTFTTDSQNDFSVQLNAAKKAGADLLFMPVYYDAASLILQQADGMGFAPKFFGVDGMDGLLTLSGFDKSLAEGVMLLTPFSADAEDERTQNFVNKYKEKYGEVPNQFAADAYDCIYALHQACTEGKVTPDMAPDAVCEVMLEQFKSMQFEGLTTAGKAATWNEKGEVTKAPKGMVIKDGAYVGM